MQIQDMFKKSISRDLQGVIIVGQGKDANVGQELDEYVVTRELYRHLEDFFEAYKKGITGPTSKMGVWISGFFGSGKSHFLKILSYLLENKEVNGRHALDYFIQDDKIKTDSILQANMKLAAETPTDVILFNIDSKSESNSKQNKDAIVDVFLKVFNNMQGYCGSMPHLADLERRLTEEGKFDVFKQAFEENYGDSWEASRQDFDFIQDDVVDTLVDMDFMSEAAARNWCEKAAEPYHISIEDFAKRVKKYIDSKGKNHHVVFLVDEIGQYIGEDTRLMLNLQTVTEELGKECMGKAWVIVTSQQDIDSITNVRENDFSNDFSKIQGRFDTRLSLSSANVDEVIKKRILDKTDTAAQALRVLYEQKATDIRNKIIFTDTAEKKLYANAEDFAQVYPFVNYQFDLLGDALTAIRTHGASGKHLSEGERSMLALFKESAADCKYKPMGELIPFHRFYDALENFLDHSHSVVIRRAYDNTHINPEQKQKDVFAVDVLKTLFMIKYVTKCEATLDNITSLMFTSIDQERGQLKERVEEALKVLMREMLVQKNGSIYVFLTDEEQEINRDIEKINVEMPDVIAKVGEMIFDDIFTDKKYRSPEFNGRYTFAFNQYVDDRPHKSIQTNPFGLRVLTPAYDGGREIRSLRLMSSQRVEVLVVLPDDNSFIDEVRTVLKIDRFLRTGGEHRNLTKFESIVSAKQAEMKNRDATARVYLTEALREATVYSNGDILNLNAKDIGSRINEALGRLVQTVYHKLSYIDSAMDEADIRKMFHTSNMISVLADGAVEYNPHAQDDLRAFIHTNSQMHMKTSMKTVRDRFMKAPYGFVEDDVNWLVARLFKRGDIRFTVNNEPVSTSTTAADTIVDYIVRKGNAEKLLMEERVKVSDKDKKNVREVMKELFGVSVTGEDEDGILQNFRSYASGLEKELEKLAVHYEKRRYPGARILDGGRQLLRSIEAIRDPLEFFAEVSDKKDDFWDFAEDFEPVRQFFGGEQRKIYDTAMETLAIYEDSKAFIVDPRLEEIAQKMHTIIYQEKPYKNIPQLPELRDSFNEAYMELLQKEETPVRQTIEAAVARVMEALQDKDYAAEYRESIIRQFDDLKQEAESCNNISSLRSCGDKADALKIRWLNQISRRDADEARKKAPPHTEPAGENPAPQPVHVRTTRSVSAKQVTGTASWRLENAADVDRHLDELRKKLLAQLDDDTILNVEF